MKNFAGRIRNRRGQSTVELALILPTLCFFLFLIIYAFRVNHTLSEQSITSYANRLEAFNHGNGLAFDPVKGQDVPAGQFSEHIPPGGAINLGDIAKSAAGLAAQLGLGEIFSKLKIGDTYAGGFAKGFSYSIVNSATQNFIQGGSWNDLDAKDIEHATWAGAAGAFSSAQATEDFQGDKATGTQEFFGSGAQAGLIGYARSEGDWKAGVSSAAGGMLNSNTTKEFVNDEDSTNFANIMKGAGVGAVQSSISGSLNGNFDIKNVLYSSAAGAVSTEAFAKAIPFTGKDAKNSTMYGAFNGAFSSVLSGGNLKTTLIAAGAGALGSNQTATFLGGAKTVGYRASTMGYQAGAGFASGQSAQAVGAGAISGLVSDGIGWIGNEISSSVSEKFQNTNSPEDAKDKAADPAVAQAIAQDPSRQNYMNSTFTASNSAIFNSFVLNSFLHAKNGSHPK